MAKTRMVNTKLWTDPWIQDLSVEDKLLFVYLISNSHTELCGIYELSVKTIEFETGIDYQRLSKAMDRLSEAGKVFYVDGYVILRNFQKHQQNNPKIQAGIKRTLNELPLSIKSKIGLSKGQNDRLCIDYDSLSHLTILNLTKPNLTKLNLNFNRKSPKEDFGAKTSKKKKYMTMDNFNTFWNKYPNKKGKSVAIDKFLKLESKLLESILKSLDQYKSSSEWKEDNGKYIPHGSTWVSQARWMDDVEEDIPEGDIMFVEGVKMSLTAVNEMLNEGKILVRKRGAKSEYYFNPNKNGASVTG